jgi:hypothetical protein
MTERLTWRIASYYHVCVQVMIHMTKHKSPQSSTDYWKLRAPWRRGPWGWRAATRPTPRAPSGAACGRRRPRTPRTTTTTTTWRCTAPRSRTLPPAATARTGTHRRPPPRGPPTRPDPARARTEDHVRLGEFRGGGKAAGFYDREGRGGGEEEEE